MDRLTLFDYINGRCSNSDAEAVRKWAEENLENKAYLQSLMSVMAIGSSKTATEEEYSAFMKLVRKRKYSSYRKFVAIAAIAVFLLSLGANVIFMTSRNKPLPTEPYAHYLDNQLPLDSLTQVISVSRGARSSITLPDGSKVWLNSDSKLTFPLAFASDKRSVELSGEAYFDVVSNEECPMLISLKDDYMIEVKGTEFNVRSYEDEEGTQTVLYSGVINLFKKNTEKQTVNKVYNMKPKEICTVEEESITVQHSTEDKLAKISSWKEGNIYFDDTSLGEVLKRIERHHGVNITVSDPSILNYSITAHFEDESAVQIMDMLRYCAPIDYEVKGDNFTLFRR